MSDDLQPIPLPNSLEKLKTLCNEKSVYAVANGDKDRTVYGRMMVKDERIWIYSFQSDKTGATALVNFNDLIVRYNESTGLGWPKTAFLQLSPDIEDKATKELKNAVRNYDDEEDKGSETMNDEEDNDLKEPMEEEPRNLNNVSLVIETEGLSNRTRNFLLVCTALNGYTYIGCKIKCYPEFYVMELGQPPKAAEDNDNNDLCFPKNTEFIWGIDETESWLFVTTRGRPSAVYKKDGEIVAGFQDMENPISDYIVTNCGIVI